MKKLLLASAVAALSVSAAQAAPTVYGKAFLSVDYEKNKPAAGSSTDSTKLNSNASRIGFKGSEALTANTDLLYQLEYRVEVDHDNRDPSCTSTFEDLKNPADSATKKDINDSFKNAKFKCRSDRNFESRDTYLGLSHKQFGTVLAGRLTTIDGMIDYANVTNGGVVGGDNVLASYDAQRVNNALAYVSPEYNGLQFLSMYAMDENNGTDSLDRSAWGAGVKYEPAGQPFKAGLTFIDAGKRQIVRASGSFDVNKDITVGALYQLDDSGMSGDKKENAYTVSGSYKTPTPWTAYGQLDFVQNVGFADGVKSQRVVAGGKYAFNKATTAHVYGAYQENKNSGSKDKVYGVGTGIEYKF